MFDQSYSIEFIQQGANCDTFDNPISSYFDIHGGLMLNEIYILGFMQLGVTKHHLISLNPYSPQGDA